MHRLKISILGVLNVTPDSFVPESRVQSIDEIIGKAKQFLADGADILEIGGESTGPTSSNVSVEEELSRVIPAVEALRKALPQVRIAVDTYKAEVAKAALKAGATMINDVTAGRGDSKMFAVIASSDCSYVMMYAKDKTARTIIADEQYDNVIATIHEFLESRVKLAEEAGIDRSRIVIDPGLGHFVSSDPKYSWEILHSLKKFSDLGPILVSPSRKSFLAGPKNLPVSERLQPTLEASLLAAKNGAAYIRTHDVKETCQVLSTFF